MENSVRGGRAALVALIAVFAVACGPVVELQLPTVADLDELAARRLPVPSVIVDADGDELAVLQREFREPISLTQVPRHTVRAVLIAEDQRFYEHGGVDGRSVARAALTNTAQGATGQGGSTITQQLVKELYMPDAPRSPETKIQEALLARQLERELPKADILEQYLNTIYFGEGAYGLGAAAWTYFRVPVQDLSVEQAALLAAIIRAPEAFAPTRAPLEAKQRRDDVLWRMASEGYLTADERDAAIATPIEVHDRPAPDAAREPHFVDLVLRTLQSDPTFGATAEQRDARLYGGGLTIHTTVRPDLQDLARATLAETLDAPGDPDAAIAAVDPVTGHVLAAVGTRAYDDLQFDLATQARRQPGSTFKTFVLASAVSDGWHPDDTLDGRQGVIQTSETTEWEVNNYDRRSYDAVTLAGATRASVNTAYVRLGLEVGIDRVAAMAQAMGVESTVPRDPQIAIGGGSLGVTALDLATAYGTIGNLGERAPTVVVSHVTDRAGRTVWEPSTRPQQALSPSAAYVTAEVLRDAVDHGTGQRATVAGWQVAGKTGTTSGYTDAWFAGTTTALATAVWVGHADGPAPMRDVQGYAQVTGGSLPAAIFSRFVTAALEGVEPVDFELPPGEYTTVSVDPVSGLRSAAWCPGELQRLPKVLAPTETCPEPEPEPEPPPAPDPAELEPVIEAEREPAIPIDGDAIDDGTDPADDPEGDASDGVETEDGSQGAPDDSELDDVRSAPEAPDRPREDARPRTSPRNRQAPQ